MKPQHRLAAASILLAGMVVGGRAMLKSSARGNADDFSPRPLRPKIEHGGTTDRRVSSAATQVAAAEVPEPTATANAADQVLPGANPAAGQLQPVGEGMLSATTPSGQNPEPLPPSAAGMAENHGPLRHELNSAEAGGLEENPDNASAADQADAGIPLRKPDPSFAYQTEWLRAVLDRQPPKQPVLPVALSEADPAAAGVTPDLEPQLEAVRERFAQDIGADELDPAEPEYRQRWLRAQPIADQQLRAIIGWQRFAEYQRQAQHQANPANPPAAPSPAAP